jgi:tetratricopeptide (TPR) repeat protein
LYISRELGYKEGLAQALFSLGNISGKYGKMKEAIRYYQECLTVADSINLMQVLMSAHLALSKILQDNHQNKEALFHYQRYTQAKDTIFNTERARIITELETRYETEKKQQENDLLIKDNELKDKRIDMLYMIIGGFFILIMVIALLIIQYRKTSLGKKLLAESEAARLAEKVDHQNQELASGALALSRNLSFLNKLLEDLKSLSSHVEDQGIQNLKGIIRDIQHLDTDPAWSEFEMRFQKVHTRFYDKLTNEFPILTSNEMRLCALIKLGMNTKEISTVTFQNIRAIEAARLRLRKKLQLGGTEDLGAFLQKI